MTNLSQYYAPDEVRRWRAVALGVGGIGSLVVLGAALISPEWREQALRSWLLGYILWAGIGFGGLGILILQYLTGGAWGVVVRRTVEAASRTWPIIVILFIPIAIGVYTASIYNWTHLPRTEHVMEH